MNMTERMTERLLPTIKKQSIFLKALEEKRQTSSTRSCLVIPASEEMQSSGSNNPQPLPNTFPLDSFPLIVRMALQNDSEDLKCSRRTKIRTMLIQVLFDRISQISMYPSHRQYVEFLSSFVFCFPFLREKTGSGYDALHQSLKNKMKKERRPLVMDETVRQMKEKFSVATSGRKRHASLEEPQVIQKMRRNEVLHDMPEMLGEDERTISSHVLAMSTEAGKARPNLEDIQTNLTKTRSYRRQFMMENTTSEIISKFPCLRMPKLLTWEMKMMFAVDVDKMILSNLNALADNIIKRAAPCRFKDNVLKPVYDCIDDNVKRGLRLGAAILLLPGLFKENASALYVAEKIPDIPTPAMSLLDCEEGNLLNPGRILLYMDGIEIVEEDTTMDISYTLGLLYALYYVYGIAYPKALSKTLLFLERFVFKMNVEASIPVTVARVYNSLV